MTRKFILVSAILGLLASSRAGAEDVQTPPVPDGAALVQRACVGCHAIETITGKGHTAQEWSDIVDRMADRGVDATDAELLQIKAYLARTLPPAAAAGQ
jgi:mono/diheme cytochrome c family protein